MSDPRHGTVAGYNRIPCREDCCRRAMANYKKRWEWDRINGRTRIVDATGTRRRIEALAALGWSHHVVGARIDMTGTNLARIRKADTVTAAVAARVAQIYDELSMQLPIGAKQPIANTKRIANERGWLPPLAWDDIDNPEDKGSRGLKHTPKTSVDETVVVRILAGEPMPCTIAEKREVLRRWPGSMGELERLTGWRTERYKEAS